jgi:hypothetical protein
MNENKGIYRLVGIGLIASAILSSCSGALTPTAPAMPAISPTALNQAVSNTEVATNVPAATATAAPAATDTSTLAPTATQTAIPTVAATATVSSPLSAQVVPTLNANCHKGPATGYDVITFLLKGTAYNLTGRDSLKSWWQVKAPGNVTCWVPDANVTTQGSVEQVAIAQVPALPGLPVPFDSSYVCKPALKSLTVALNWGAVYNATGYRIFRDGTILVEIGPSVTSYSDSAAPLKETVVYELEAFNDYGVAAHLSTTIPACQ